jgi:hypothetical protein
MRTTLNIDDEVLEQVKQNAAARSMPTGQAASCLLNQALNKPLGTRIENGFEVFDLPDDSPIVTLEHVQKMIDEL